MQQEEIAEIKKMIKPIEKLTENKNSKSEL